MTHPALPHGSPTPGPAELVRSEEQLVLGTEVVAVGRAVLRVETTTEQVMVPVTITRQHARLEYRELDPGAPDVPVDRSAAEAVGPWITLTADEPVVTVRPVPVERVRLVTGWVAGQQDVTVELAHEEITSDVTPTR